jgi:hypothetical protein
VADWGSHWLVDAGVVGVVGEGAAVVGEGAAVVGLGAAVVGEGVAVVGESVAAVQATGSGGGLRHCVQRMATRVGQVSIQLVLVSKSLDSV